MRNKRILVSLLVGLVILSLTACAPTTVPEPTQLPTTVGTLPPQNTPTSIETATVTPDAGSGVPVTATCSNALFPVVQGATWTYVVNGGSNGPWTYTDTITEVRPDGFTITSQHPDRTYAHEWSCTANGLLALSMDGANAEGILWQGMKAQFTTSGASGVTLPLTITPGMQWNFGLDIQGTVEYQGYTANGTGAVSTAMQETGTENVAVPAGSFDATRIQATPTFNITASFNDLSVPLSVSGSSTMWYAPGIGLVKLTESGTFAGQTISSTAELQSYSIP